MKDLYNLTKSALIDIENQGNYPATLELEAADALPYQLSGTVKDSVGDTAIANAYVAVYDTAGAFLAGDYADDSGEYAVELDAGTGYEAIASATGFVSSAPFTFSITDQSIFQEFTLTAFSDTDRVIYGKILEPDGTTTVDGARIDVIDDTGVVVATTMSIPDGEYSVPNLALGTYSLVVAKAGYNTRRVSVTIAAGSTLVETDVQLTAFSEPTGSTVSGYITQTDDTAIANAWVGLYTSPGEALLETTATNAEGFYSFEDVPNGDFVVKSKVVGQ